MTILNKFSQLPDGLRWWTAVGITFTLASLITLFGIYGIGEYGVAMFILTPFFVGFCASALYGYKHHITRAAAFGISAATIGIMLVALLLLAIEGVICIIMASPLALLFMWLGSLLAHLLVTKKPASTIAATLALMLFVPLTGFVERKTEDDFANVTPVVTSVKIKASQQTVWKYVVAFPELKAPQELLFKAGIAYPVNATIHGEGAGAMRYCNFNTGCFVEPVTTWDPPRLLAFDVQQSPQPMTELSFWDIDAPHLHDYFVSKKGQFRIIRVSETETILEGTTWYNNRIKPNFYWNLWSDHIVHKIHERVLNHIKEISEQETDT